MHRNNGVSEDEAKQQRIKVLLAREEKLEAALDKEDPATERELRAKLDRVWKELDELGYDDGGPTFTSNDGADATGPKSSPFKKAYTPYGDGHLPILAVMHGNDVRHGQRFHREDPKDREAFCRFVRGYIIYNFACVLRDSKKLDPMKMEYPANPPRGFDPNDRWHRARAAALHQTKCGYADWKEVRCHGERGRQFIEDHGLALDDLPRFRISLALFGSEYEYLSLRDLRVLAAVNSCLINGFGTINLEVLSWRAVGASSREQLALLGVEPLTEKQVRRALDRLEADGLIQRLVVGRTTYAAKGNMSESDFQLLVAKRVFKGKAKRGFLQNGKLHIIPQVVCE